MLEAANVLKSSGKELLALVPRESKFADATNKIQNAIYWLNASLKSLSPCNGHATQVAVAGSVNVDDLENVDPDPKGLKKLQKVLPDPCNKGTDLYKEYHCYFVNIKDPRYNIKRGAPTRFVPDDTMCHCGESFDSPGEVAQKCVTTTSCKLYLDMFYLWVNNNQKRIHLEAC